MSEAGPIDPELQILSVVDEEGNVRALAFNFALHVDVIGGGSAGLTAVGFAVQLGARVVLLEGHRIGGDCTWTGCVPSKTLLKAAKVAHHMRTADRHGLIPTEPRVDLKSVMARVRSVIQQVYQHESADALRAEGIDVFLEAARFLDSHTVAIADNTLTARNILLATGAYPLIPPIPGLDGVNYLTYETIWGLEVLPEHFIMLGAGPIGCEMATHYGRWDDCSPWTCIL